MAHDGHDLLHAARQRELLDDVDQQRHAARAPGQSIAVGLQQRVPQRRRQPPQCVLRDDIGGAGRQPLLRTLLVRVAADEDEGRSGLPFTGQLQRLQTVQARHLAVAEDRVEAVLAQRLHIVEAV
ncbi:hypothetical protein Mpe_A2741 [Methylibium petroleiphilum PM1]|uniref:Uncharacterized protein n=1 Tax=Methylibium petroleiphilum (strain ATCC BAA-1232 / LMG 22953 / PM1) TaxID=420662 RepID=A2SJF6_METPP|nr:hypothetical protein [Methylibium petroleiphilum]ABM95695.1 hypothetical protein Mpe_A2741 [Methylibium petroleiphilum PM1]